MSAEVWKPPAVALLTSAVTDRRYRYQLGTLLFCVPRIIRGIHIIDLPRANSMELDDCFAIGPGRVFHSSRPVAERPGWKFFRAAPIERLTGCEIKCPRNHSDSLSLRMCVWRDMIASRKLKTHYERPVLRWVAFKHGHLCAGRYGCRPRFPFHGCGRIKAHVCGLGFGR